MIINIDFDGTCLTHDFPDLGKDIGAVEVLKQLIDKEHQLILFTMRSDQIDRNYLTEAVEWFENNDIPLYGIQVNPTQHEWTTSPKSYAHLMIDDAALGCPLKFVPEFHSRPFVDWASVEKLLIQQGIL